MAGYYASKKAKQKKDATKPVTPAEVFQTAKAMGVKQLTGEQAQAGGKYGGYEEFKKQKTTEDMSKEEYEAYKSGLEEVNKARWAVGAGIGTLTPKVQEKLKQEEESVALIKAKAAAEATRKPEHEVEIGGLTEELYGLEKKKAEEEAIEREELTETAMKDKGFAGLAASVKRSGKPILEAFRTSRDIYRNLLTGKKQPSSVQNAQANFDLAAKTTSELMASTEADWKIMEELVIAKDELDKLYEDYYNRNELDLKNLLIDGVELETMIVIRRNQYNDLIRNFAYYRQQQKLLNPNYPAPQ